MGFNFKFTHKDANKLLLGLILFEVFLSLVFALDIVLETSWQGPRIFDLDGEATIPAWFSSLQLFLIGVLFLFSRNWPQINRVFAPNVLLLVGCGFVFLSMDEAASFHEGITYNLDHIDWIPKFKGGHGIWIPIYLIMALVLVAASVRTIKSVFQVYSRQATIMLSGALVFLAGAVGLEIIGYQYVRGSEYSHLYEIEVLLEELLEMVGASIILYGTVLCALSKPPQAMGRVLRNGAAAKKLELAEPNGR